MRRRLVAVGVPLCLVLAGYLRLQQLNARPLDPHAFSTVTLAEIYAIGVFMAALGYPVAPEAAKLHVGLMRRQDSTTPRRFVSTAVGASPVVRAAARRACASGRANRLSWPMASYRITGNARSRDEARVALALNGGRVECRNGRATAVITVSYPPRAMATFVSWRGRPLLGIQEGLFHVLQVRGWYTPYVAQFPITSSR